MPASEASIVIGLDNDGIREAKKLCHHFPNSTRYTSHDKVQSIGLMDRATPLFLIVVCHISTGTNHYYKLIEMLKNIYSCPPIIVLAMCYSNLTSDFNGYSFAQRVSTATGKEVRATTRVLLFSEVGNATAFAKSGIADFVLPTNNDQTGELWTTVKPLAGDDNLVATLSDLSI